MFRLIDKDKLYDEKLKSFKKELASYEIVNCINEDLKDTEFDSSQYSEDLNLYRDKSDKFVYLLDNDDEVENKVSIDDLKVILHNLTIRIIEEQFERDELDKFLSLEDGE